LISKMQNPDRPLQLRTPAQGMRSELREVFTHISISVTSRCHRLKRDLRPSTATIGGFKFMSLPPELRNMIYRYLVPDEPVSITRRNFFSKTPKIHQRTAFLRTCSQIRREASQVFYTHAKFSAKTSSLFFHQQRNQTLEWLRLIGEERTSSITHLSIDLGNHECWCSTCHKAFALYLMHLGVSLDSIHVSEDGKFLWSMTVTLAKMYIEKPSQLRADAITYRGFATDCQRWASHAQDRLAEALSEGAAEAWRRSSARRITNAADWDGRAREKEEEAETEDKKVEALVAAIAPKAAGSKECRPCISLSAPPPMIPRVHIYPRYTLADRLSSFLWGGM